MKGKRKCPLLDLFTWFQDPARALKERGGSKGSFPDSPTLLASGTGHHRLTPGGSFQSRDGCSWLHVVGGRVKTEQETGGLTQN